MYTGLCSRNHAHGTTYTGPCTRDYVHETMHARSRTRDHARRNSRFLIAKAHRNHAHRSLPLCSADLLLLLWPVFFVAAAQNIDPPLKFRTFKVEQQISRKGSWKSRGVIGFRGESFGERGRGDVRQMTGAASTCLCLSSSAPRSAVLCFVVL